MCQHAAENTPISLSYECMLTDPLIRMVMDADGVTLAELVSVLALAQAAIVARECQPAAFAMFHPRYAMSGRA